MQQMPSFDGRVFMMTVREELHVQAIEDSVVDVLQCASVSLSRFCQMVRIIHLHRR